MSMPRILLIDDDDHFRKMLRVTLERAGYQVEDAANGRRGIELYTTEPTDLVITDLVMPDKEGLETITELKSFDEEVKIIAISGGGRVGPWSYLGVAQKFGARAALAKPFSHDELLAVVASVLQPPAQ
jgi:DNA-binding NtrC family response regulator